MIKEVATSINTLLRRSSRLVLWALMGLLVGQSLAFYFLHARALNLELSVWLPSLIVANAVLLLFGLLFLLLLQQLRSRMERRLSQAVGRELNALRAANDRARSLQMMASTLSATLSFERVVEQALDVCSLALEDMGIPGETLLGGVFLYEDGVLAPLAERGFVSADADKVLQGESGMVGASLEQAEPTVTDNPLQDPELKAFATFRNCLTVVSIPLRAGFQLFGVMVIGTKTAVRFEEEHFDLFVAVADQAVIALQNAQLYQRLEAEKQRLIAANEEARRELSRDLHDGPVQKVAVTSMRLGVLRSLISEDPEKAQAEVRKLQELVDRTTRELRGMLFTLRPLVLETQGLGPALRTVLDHVHDADDIEVQLIGEEHGDLLNPMARGVVFSIVEEMLSNARKHARADVIEVRMWVQGDGPGENGAARDDWFMVRVIDDGVGFDKEEVTRDYGERRSLGMVNMRERAERIDGSLNIDSTPGVGTIVTLAVPLDKYGREQGSEELLEAAD